MFFIFYLFLLLQQSHPPCSQTWARGRFTHNHHHPTFLACKHELMVGLLTHNHHHSTFLTCKHKLRVGLQITNTTTPPSSLANASRGWVYSPPPPPPHPPRLQTRAGGGFFFTNQQQHHISDDMRQSLTVCISPSKCLTSCISKKNRILQKPFNLLQILPLLLGKSFFLSSINVYFISFRLNSTLMLSQRRCY